MAIVLQYIQSHTGSQPVHNIRLSLFSILEVRRPKDMIAISMGHGFLNLLQAQIPHGAEGKSGGNGNNISLTLSLFPFQCAVPRDAHVMADDKRGERGEEEEGEGEEEEEAPHLPD